MAATQVVPQHEEAIPVEQVQPETPVHFLQEVIDESERRLKIQVDRFEFQQRRAKMFAKSKLFGIKETDPDEAIAQAMVRIELGESMGFSPAESLQGIYIINGQTAISSALRAARMAAAGYSWDIDWHRDLDGECHGCTLFLRFKGRQMVDRQGEPVKVSFLRRDAERMLTTIWGEARGEKKRVSILEKDNWKMSPANMYFARAVTNAQRFYAPHVLSANLPSIEEVDDGAEARNERPADIPDGGSRQAQREVAERRIRELTEQNRAMGISTEDGKSNPTPEPTSEDGDDPRSILSPDAPAATTSRVASKPTFGSKFKPESKG